jgi:hypothetical protein
VKEEEGSGGRRMKEQKVCKDDIQQVFSREGSYVKARRRRNEAWLCLICIHIQN